MPRGVVEGIGEDEARMNMTPMIDIVFQLIIFFMVVTELSNLNMAQVTLPKADHLTIEKKRSVEEREVTINVVLDSKSPNRRGDVVISGRSFMKKDGTLDFEKLKGRLLTEAEKYGMKEPNPFTPGQEDSLLKVLVRADKNVRAEYLQLIYQACQAAGIFKVQIGAEQHRAEGG